MSGPDLSVLDTARVYEALLQHRGEANAIRRPHLETLLGMSDRRIRAAIHTLVTERKLPICSLPNGCGYFVCATPAELERAVRFMQSYGFECLERARALQESFATFEAEQLGLGVA